MLKLEAGRFMESLGAMQGIELGLCTVQGLP
jgi:hypothetical protein